LPETLGMIGLGAMGLPLAHRLAQAGFRLLVHDIDPGVVAMAVEGGTMTAAASVAEVAEGVEILVTCLPDHEAVDAVYAQITPRGLHCCDCSTVWPGHAMRLHAELDACGITYTECPMIGNAAQAASGDLYLLVSGNEDAVAELRPVLEAIGRAHRFLGGPGTASRFKIVQDGLGLVQAAAIAEALGILAAAGDDLDAFCEIVRDGQGMAGSPLFNALAPLMLQPAPEPTGRLRIGAKDIDLAAALAAELGFAAPHFADAKALFDAAIAAGLGESDLSSIARAIEIRSGVTIAGRPAG
jgi:3-hydroxyisobutyrate dehydrogenase